MKHSEPRALTGFRGRLAGLLESSAFTIFVTCLILVNAVSLGLETDRGTVAVYGETLHLVDQIILGLFTVELALKFYTYRLSFFRSGWNVFDLIIVAISWAPAHGPLAILRSLRVLRVLRLLSVVPALRRVISAIGHSLPGMFSVISVLCLVFYVSAVLSTKLFGHHPDPRMQEWFGSVGASAYTLFQIMTLESWSMGIVRPTMELFPLAWLFFVPFIIVTSFAVLNLFIGIIVDAMQTAHNELSPEDRRANGEVVPEDIVAIHQRFDELQRELRTVSQALQNDGRSLERSE